MNSDRKKWAFSIGTVFALPEVILVFFNCFTSLNSGLSYGLLVLLTSPVTILSPIIPKYGVLGMGDVLGFVYLSDAMVAGALYFGLGMFAGSMIYQLRYNKDRSRARSITRV